jgi:hypothetical protein
MIYAASGFPVPERRVGVKSRSGSGRRAAETCRKKKRQQGHKKSVLYNGEEHDASNESSAAVWEVKAAADDRK